MRALDKFYVAWFLLCIPLTIFIDGQPFVAKHRIPSVLLATREDWIRDANDFLISEKWSGPVEEAWFSSFVWIEFFFQLPAFFFAAYGLIKGWKSTYILMVAYGVCTATTVLPCVATYYTAFNVGMLTQEQFGKLLMGYLPFFFIPLFMAVDCGLLLKELVETKSKGKGKRA